METYNVKIDKRTKIGKMALQFLKSLSEFKKGVEVTKEHTQADLKPEVLESLRQNDKKGVENLKTFDTAEELFKDLGI